MVENNGASRLTILTSSNLPLCDSLQHCPTSHYLNHPESRLAPLQPERSPSPPSLHRLSLRWVGATSQLSLTTTAPLPIIPPFPSTSTSTTPQLLSTMRPPALLLSVLALLHLVLAQQHALVVQEALDGITTGPVSRRYGIDMGRQASGASALPPWLPSLGTQLAHPSMLPVMPPLGRPTRHHPWEGDQQPRLRHAQLREPRESSFTPLQPPFSPTSSPTPTDTSHSTNSPLAPTPPQPRPS